MEQGKKTILEVQYDIWEPESNLHSLLIFRCCGACDDLHELSRNDCLTGAVEQDLKLGDHVAGVLGGVLDGCC